MEQNGLTIITDFKRLPVSERKTAARSKYAQSVAMYAASTLSIAEVARECGVTARGLSAHLAAHHRELLYARYGLDEKAQRASAFKVRPQKGQSLKTHIKYKEAIEACGDIAYIEFNISQIARMFNLDGTALASQLRVHYPDIMPAREKERQRLGIADNTPRGPRLSSSETYSRAMAMYRDTDLSIPEVARQCDVSESGFSQFMRFYHKDIIAAKAGRRKAAGADSAARKAGRLSGNGCLYGPQDDTVAQYSAALELYRTTGLTLDEIVARTGVPYEGFRGYLHRWHEDGIDKGKLRHTAAKYAPAIESLRSNPRPVTAVAKEFGFNPDVFRAYLKAHEPELAAEQGMVRLPGGKLVKKSSGEKYGPAVAEYASSAEPLVDIARRHGLVYNSIVNFILRNCPEAKENHQKLVEKAARTV